MAESMAPKAQRMQPWLVPGALFAALLAALLGIVLLAREAGKSDAPPEPAAFQPPPPLKYIAYDVEQSSGGKLKLTTGSAKQTTSIEMQLDSTTRIWLLEPTTVEALQPPLVVNVVSIPNEVRNYTIRMLAFAPAPETVDFSGAFIPLADNFAGYEPSRDATERVVVSAILESFDGRNGVTRTSTGPGTLYIDPGAPIRLLRKGSPEDVAPGDRIAFHLGADGKPDLSHGALVLRGEVQ
jgi:hypothetical protein